MSAGEGRRGPDGPGSGGDLYRELFMRVRDGYAKVDADGRFVGSNPAFRAIVGYDEDELSGLTSRDITPESWHGAEARIIEEQVMTRGRSDPYEKEYRRKDGRPVPVEVVTYLSWGMDGAPDGMWAHVRESSARKRAEETARRSREFERLLTTISSDFIDVPPEETDAEISHALRLIAEFAGIDRSYMFQFSPDGTTMSNTHEWCAEGIASHIDELRDIPVAAFGWSVATIRRLEPIHVDDVSRLPPEAAPERAEFEREGIRSIAFLPVSLRGKAIGFIGFDAVVRPREWAEEDIALLRIVGDIFANALDRKRSASELRREHMMRQMIIDTSPAGIVVVDARGNIRFANPTAERVLGLEVGDITSRAYNDPGWHITDHDGGEFREEDLPFHIVRRTGRGV
ncbi:MAG: PAS domain S-box protein, partial [Thermoplasmata archaeon]|nr:PAS domain S-box protein [Thermoplasmata archaeon]